VGLRNTLEPDPDNTGVGSFRIEAAFLQSMRESLLFHAVEARGAHARIRGQIHAPTSNYSSAE
jgi:hypothetical protein